MNAITPVPRDQVDARYELSRLAELLPAIERNLRLVGVSAEDAADIGADAAALAARVRQLREAALLRRTAA